MSISDRIIDPKKYQFSTDPSPQIKLTDAVVCYSDGIDIKIVPLFVMKKYPVIHDYNNNKMPISLVVCPFTLASSVFEGHVLLTEETEKSSIVLQLNSEKFNAVVGSKLIKRHEAQIKTLRNAFTDHIHSKHFYFKKKKMINVPNILDDSYYEISDSENISPNISPDNSSIDTKSFAEKTQNTESKPESLSLPTIIHNKTLIYMILYESSQTHNVKCTVILGKNSSNDVVSGYNIYESGVAEYLKNHKEKIQEKFGFVMPILWFAHKLFYPDAKIVVL